jgi:hypothetical protein
VFTVSLASFSSLIPPHSSLVEVCGNMVEVLEGWPGVLRGRRRFALHPLDIFLEVLLEMRSLTSSAATLLLMSALLMTAAAGQGAGGTAKKPETKAPPAQSAPADGVPRIAQAEARDAFEKGKAIFVDVRGEDSYRAGHIKGALWMPDVAQRVKELPRDKMIITYCS